MGGTLIAGRYRLLERLGAGPMSEVWLAEDSELERRVALKLLARDANRARFDREARAAAALAHPNITQLYDYGESEGRRYMVLEYLPGGTLEERLADRAPLPEDEARRIAAALAAGLAHAHDRGLVHRDLKPSNVLFDAEGRPKVADFGIARLGVGDTLTEAGTVLGTAAYISPEQAGGRTASPASDVYSFGVILFRLLTGRLPFEATQPMELVALHRDAPPPSVAAIEPKAPADLAALADESLAKDPAQRPADGRALAAALGVGAPTTSTAFGDGSADETQVLPAAAPPARRARRRRGPVAAGVAALVLAAAGVGLAFAVTHDSGPAADTFTLDTSVQTRKLPKLGTTPDAVATHAQTTETQSTTREQTTGAAPTTRPTTTAPAPATPAPLTTEAVTTEPGTTAPTTTVGTVGTTTTVP